MGLHLCLAASKGQDLVICGRQYGPVQGTASQHQTSATALQLGPSWVRVLLQLVTMQL
jgi:hypothetical protein